MGRTNNVRTQGDDDIITMNCRTDSPRGNSWRENRISDAGALLNLQLDHDLVRLAIAEDEQFGGAGFAGQGGGEGRDVFDRLAGQ